MRIKNTNFLYTLALMLLLAPAAAFAQVTYPSGIEQCGKGIGGALSSSVGSYTPIGGPYVPVVDSAVELNTATLVYKECVLRTIVNKQKEAATTAIVRDEIQKFMSQRNGGPMFPVYLAGDQIVRSDASLNRTLQSPALNALNASFRNLIKGAVALNYSVDTRAYNNTVACPYQGNIYDITSGKQFSLSGFLNETDPRCDPLFAYYAAQNIVERNIALDQQEMMYRLMTSNGVYGNEGFDQNGNRITTMPGTFVQGNVQQALSSGFVQLQNANDVGQIVSATFASMGDQAMTAGSITPSNTVSGGLFNLTGAGSGSLSVLDQLLKSALGNLSGGNTGGGTASSTEQRYHDITVSIRDNLLSPTATGIQTADAKCWGSTGTTTHSQDFINNHQLTQLNNQTLGALITVIQSNIQTSETALQNNQQVHTTDDLTNITTLQQGLQIVLPSQVIQDAIDLWLSTAGVDVGCGT